MWSTADLLASDGVLSSVEDPQDSFSSARGHAVISPVESHRSRKRRMSLDDRRASCEWDACCAQDGARPNSVQPPLFIIRRLCLEAAEKRASQVRVCERERTRMPRSEGTGGRQEASAWRQRQK
mmetsp:Transcript_59817/g.122750  ORF Transcript_59817/g.122750 Transcript_59817/m.122750 type:complete len:124 (+) Transcript_59817:182-553(+)|eukprot:CAMPEP_0181315550 /NCGR_PEP_ID=MMETSP1101-20121128/15438_1 /TAXON_ID=46948 /ORGANISM="Rhodomonas abbreviata, Strain Caron Lab Isolate" /LENGTH=123 /DNA_ID=CAMNT_0023422771 /DNA_START=182 /DNA_END=553 /DNA_ORIENTATION=+